MTDDQQQAFKKLSGALDEAFRFKVPLGAILEKVEFFVSNIDQLKNRYMAQSEARSKLTLKTSNTSPIDGKTKVGDIDKIL